MTDKAASLVDQAKQWATYYGEFTEGEQSVVLATLLRQRAAWENNDADGVAEVFAENGSVLFGDEQLVGRESIRSYMAEAFSGRYKNSRFVDEPLEIRLLTESVAVVISQGGVLAEHEQELPTDREVRTTWIMVLHDEQWWLISQQSSPVTG
ncbi:conserved hypothetical protein [Actinopolyspora mzabensis]|uniref:SnoaL-like domain-containing protein n=1 Tax=Actinopolyspora mzabensis TaxID=995066 RepID=A0A1G8Y6S1_ACTMZ|nr:SgcJ/EcaC family oxidoreductase [Actinopolyspora mzabensis]SDJ98094.1 conserved hypothetical protein [Actinopolyspora mzabensis]